MRRILIATAALALSACAGLTPQQIAGTASSGLYAAATIAQAGTVDERIAPAYTSNAMARQRAARMLQDGRIDTATARAVLTSTDAARTSLDAARLAPSPAALEQHINTAREHIAAANALMETAR